ncbi:MAG: glycerol-3-phosphate dehydrogenase [Proteobacteria bacterium]|nr:glycerol-3-phosphate dehydrogenase [Pseudomonadota bacterium]
MFMRNMRKEMIEQLEQEFDIVIIGGGITGVGAARDAAYRGLKVALIEMEDLAFGTSSRSSKLVHGGLRYLENLEFSLVFEAVSERKVLMEIAPHLVLPLGFLFPVYSSSRRSVFTVSLGMWVYDALSLFRSPKLHRNLSSSDVAKEEPFLRREGLKGAPLYYDCSTDDARLTLETAIDAAKHGAVVATYVQVEDFLYDKDGLICGVQVYDRIAQEHLKVRSKVVINATGPWSDRTRNLNEGTQTKAINSLRPTKGVHIVVNSDRLKTEHAVVCFHPDDGRVLFAIPWGDQTYIGTTDTDYLEDPSDVAATKEDVLYLLEASNHYFPDSNLTQKDVISTWAGVRPLVSEQTEGGEASESSVSREHSIRKDPDGLISIAGGKLTTYRRMGTEVVEYALHMLSGKNTSNNGQPKTDKKALPGAENWPKTDSVEQSRQVLVKETQKRAGQSLSQKSAEKLVEIYGTRALQISDFIAQDPSLAQPLSPHRPEVLAQVDFSVSEELASSVRDVLIRRTQIFFRASDQGLGCCDAVAQRMGKLLSWSPERIAMEIQAYTDEVDRSRRWRL